MSNSNVHGVPWALVDANRQIDSAVQTLSKKPPQLIESPRKSMNLSATSKTTVFDNGNLIIARSKVEPLAITLEPNLLKPLKDPRAFLKGTNCDGVPINALLIGRYSAQMYSTTNCELLNAATLLLGSPLSALLHSSSSRDLPCCLLRISKVLWAFWSLTASFGFLKILKVLARGS